MKSKIIYIINVLSNILFLVFFKFIRIKTTPKTLLILRTDAIGDYVLFRNFLKVIRESEIYKDHKITFCGNAEWKDLSLGLDSKYYDHSFWIDCTDYYNNPIYRFRTIWYIRKKGFETVIYPTYSRVFHFDNLVKLSGAKFRIGNSGDTTNQPIILKNISDNFYTQLIEAKKDIIFEFFRNREYFEKLLHEDLSDIKSNIDLNEIQNPELPNQYILIFPGKKALHGRWSPEKFAGVINYLYKRYNIVSVIAGGKADSVIAEKIKLNINDLKSIFDYTGKSTLIDLLHLINNSLILISNETSAVHLAAALDKTAICISNGFHVFRFDNYPIELSNKIITVYPEEIQSKLHDKDYLIQKYYNQKCPDINSISVDRIIQEIDNIFKK